MRRSIFIVEDDDNVSQLLAFVFRREGFETTVLHDGRSAVEHVAAGSPPDAVLLDAMLPCRDGCAVARAIRAHPRWSGVPIVMLSAHPGAAEQQRARAAGVDAFVAKPFRPASLVGQVNAVLRAVAA